MASITKIPGLPDYFRGVLNLRGKVIPVADLRTKLRLTSVEPTERTCIVVVELTAGGRASLGLVVDAVEEVANIGASDLEGPPDFGGMMDTTGILGMAKVKGQVKTLLDIDQIIRADNLPVFKAQAAAHTVAA